MTNKPENKEEKNQCDGCARNLPLKDGVHSGGGYDLIGCTKERYISQTPMPHTNEEMERRFDDDFTFEGTGDWIDVDKLDAHKLKDFINQEISDLKKSIREEIEKVPVYYRSKFSQDCSREETHNEKNTEMIERSLVLEILSLKSLE